MRQDMKVQVSSLEEGWITTPEITVKVKNILGFIDLDPASSVDANKIVCANSFLTKEDDMLTRDLICDTLYMNPPYGKIKNKSQAGIFSEYVLNQYSKGNIKRGGIILLHDRSGYEWYEKLVSKLVCVTLKERLRFINPKTMKAGAQAKTAQALFLFGDEFADKFYQEFKDIGRFVYNRPFVNYLLNDNNKNNL